VARLSGSFLGLLLAFALVAAGCTSSDFGGGSSRITQKKPGSGNGTAKTDKDDRVDSGLSEGDGDGDGDADGNGDSGNDGDSDGGHGTDAVDSGDDAAEGGTDLGSDDGAADGRISIDEYVKSLSGVEAQKVGVNFEAVYDGGGDKDFNDAVLCFTASVKVDGSKVRFLKTETIAVHFTKRFTSCTARMIGELYDRDDKKVDSFDFTTKDPEKDLSMKGTKGGRLEVTFVAVSSCDDGREGEAWKRDMHAVSAKVLPGVCNTSGN
jgi:hypothetical protein